MIHKTYKINPESIEISVDEITRLIGYPIFQAPDYIKDEIKSCIHHAKKKLKPKGECLIINNIAVQNRDATVSVNNTIFNVGKVVSGMLNKSSETILFLCTAGEEISDLSKENMSKGDPLTGYIYDTIGSVAVEGAMDYIQNQIKEPLFKQELNITNRYSPGYCGWDVSEQKKIFSFFPNNYSNIKLTESSLMQPTKSISGIIGVGKDVKYNNYTCSICNMENCLIASRKI